MSNDLPENSDDSAFATTQWTKVLAARGESSEARAALSDLCETYYGPVEAFIRHSVRDANRSEDLAQGFFAELLRRDSLVNLERGRGKFRSYLLGAVKHFLLDHWKREQTEKRGGKIEHVPISDEQDSDPGFAVPSSGPPPDSVFDREWAMTLLARAMERLEQSEAADGRNEAFGVLKIWLTGELGGKTQADAAAELRCSEGAVKVAVHRLRKRFRQHLRAEIGQTVENEDAVREELRYLIEVLGSE